MTTGEVKDYFRQIRKEQLEVNHLIAMIERERSAVYPKAIVYDKDRVQTTPEDILAKSAAQVVQMQEELGRSVAKLKIKQASAEALIRKLEKSDEREVMRYYYLGFAGQPLLKWEDVANEMHLDKRQVFRIHGNALSNLSKTEG